MIKASIKIVLVGRPLSNGEYAVYLRVLKNRKRKNINLGLTCKKEHFKDEQFTKKHKGYFEDNDILLMFKKRASDIIKNYISSNTDFTLEEFAKEFDNSEKSKEVNVISFFDEIINELVQRGKISTSKTYIGTKKSIIKFKGSNLKFNQIDYKFLEDYETFLRQNNNKSGGVGFKMRILKAIINKARKRGVIPLEPYAFKDYKLSKLKSENIRETLTLEEFKKIKKLDLNKYPNLIEAYNYFMFSIYTRGMNFKDMMHLKWSDIRNGRLYYVRSKTKGKLNMEITPPIQKILNFYKSQNRDTDYIFPILLKEDLTPQQIFNRRHKVISRYNKKLRNIAEIVGLDKKPTSYVARHSFATILKMSGTPIEKICEMMGHKDVSVTIAYLRDFSNEDLDQEGRKFIDF